MTTPPAPEPRQCGGLQHTPLDTDRDSPSSLNSRAEWVGGQNAQNKNLPCHLSSRSLLCEAVRNSSLSPAFWGLLPGSPGQGCSMPCDHLAQPNCFTWHWDLSECSINPEQMNEQTDDGSLNIYNPYYRYRHIKVKRHLVC